MEALLLLVYLILVHHLLTSVSTNDREVLLAISDKMKDYDPMCYLAQWKTSGDDHCKWPYVTCVFNTTQVGELSLNNSALSGPIPRLLGNLSSLRCLDLSWNNFSEPIPDELGHLSKLEFLFLDHNSLNGSIPMTLTNISSLLTLDLAYNRLSGEIPRTGSLIYFKAESFQNNPDLCGDPLSNQC